MNLSYERKDTSRVRRTHTSQTLKSLEMGHICKTELVLIRQLTSEVNFMGNFSMNCVYIFIFEVGNQFVVSFIIIHHWTLYWYHLHYLRSQYSIVYFFHLCNNI